MKYRAVGICLGLNEVEHEGRGEPANSGSPSPSATG